MRTLYYDCFSGISGDMNLGALIDIGVDKDYLIKELLKLNLDEYEIKVSTDVRKGITGTKVDVILKSNYYHSHESSGHKHVHIKRYHTHVHNEYHEPPHNSEHSYDHHSNEYKDHANSHTKESNINNGYHEHDGHSHKSHNHVHKHHENNGHHHRNLRDIEIIIKESSLNENIKNISLKIFEKVAEAEAKVHGKAIEDVHFHEVGAVDSIVDIVGAAVCLDYLKVDKIKSSTVEVGSGFVKCAHGVMPVPAPATVEILKNVALKSNIPFEATTPTGAAILSYAVEEFTDSKNFKIEKIGYGIGHKDVGEVPNILRVFIGEESEDDIKDHTDESSYCINSSEDYLQDQAYVLECNIDDMNPEMYEYVMNLLFDKGALDVYVTPIIMKKGRPAAKLNVLYSIDKEEEIREIILTQTTTLGFRKYKVERNMLKREFTKIKTKYGEITIKNAYYKGKKIKSKPEYEECKRVALENNVNINEVYKEVILNS